MQRWIGRSASDASISSCGAAFSYIPCSCLSLIERNLVVVGLLRTEVYAIISRSIATILISSFAVAAGQGNDLTPGQIMERYFAAYKTLRFSEVAPYVHPRALAEYRRTTWAVIKHAAEQFGEDAIAGFFKVQLCNSWKRRLMPTIGPLSWPVLRSSQPNTRL